MPNIGLPHSDTWHQLLASEFSGLHAESLDNRPIRGTLRAAHFGDVIAYDVAGSAQVLRRSPATARQNPSEALKVCLLTRGQGVVEQHGHEVAIGTGQLALYDLSRPYRLTFDEGWRGTVVAFPRSALPLSRRDINAAMRHAHAAEAGPGTVLTGLVADYTLDPAVPAPTPFVGAAALNLVTAILWASLTEDHTSLTANLRAQAECFIHEHISDPALTAESVAAVHHVSPRTLQRAFADGGTTVSDFIRHQRLSGARRELLSPSLGHLSIAGIAARWCFYDAPHFTRAFRAAFAVTPSEVRTTISSK
ncbi:helix-turn-helix domain-containing protein [Nocardia sp. CA-119907]|uniref:AraC-like ligand-binding domain-containing protein n=1 Tax=Nocardia sp. CA-119907 TaxID=3239973 RepID=UPI003D95CFEA